MIGPDVLDTNVPNTVLVQDHIVRQETADAGGVLADERLVVAIESGTQRVR